MTHRYVPATHDPILTEMNTKWRRTDREIADEMGFDETTISRNRKRLGLPTNIRPRPLPHPAEKASKILPTEKPNPVAVATSCLGPRLVEKQSGFWLDGRPASLDTVMKAANAVLKRNGIEQVGIPRWWV